MGRRLRFTLWVCGVGGTLASPVWFRTGAPWCGAAWQCGCLGLLVWLYATTPRDAIRVRPEVGRLVILLGTALVPVACMGRLTPGTALVPLVLLGMDHVRVGARWRVGLSREPGALADWLSPVLLWSPGMWMLMAGDWAAAHPWMGGLGASVAGALWLRAVRISALTRVRPWGRRRGVATGVVLAGAGCGMVAAWV